MCMKNLNTVITTCVDVNKFENGTQNLMGIFDTIEAVVTDDIVSLENLCVVINSVVIFNDDDLKDELKLNKDYEFLVRLTHISSADSIDLGKFDLTLQESQLTKWCKKFYEFKHIIKIPSIVLPNGAGNYAIKLLVREEGAPKWTVQSLAKILIKSPSQSC